MGFGQFHVFVDGDEFHFWGDDVFFGVVHLVDVVFGFGLVWVAHVGEMHGREFGIVQVALVEFGG